MCEALSVPNLKNVHGLGGYLEKLKAPYRKNVHGLGIVEKRLAERIEKEISLPRNLMSHNTNVQFGVAAGYGYLQVSDDLLALVGIQVVVD